MCWDPQNEWEKSATLWFLEEDHTGSRPRWFGMDPFLGEPLSKSSRAWWLCSWPGKRFYLELLGPVILCTIIVAFLSKILFYSFYSTSITAPAQSLSDPLVGSIPVFYIFQFPKCNRSVFAQNWPSLKLFSRIPIWINHFLEIFSECSLCCWVNSSFISTWATIAYI